MHHLRRTVRVYNASKDLDDRTAGCTFPVCDSANTSQRSIDESETMYIIENRTSYDSFEGRRVTRHLLLLPKRHVESIADLTDHEKLDYMTLVGKYEALGYNIYSRGVASVTRSMPHVHTHLIQLVNKRAKLFLYIAKPYYLFVK